MRAAVRRTYADLGGKRAVCVRRTILITDSGRT